MLAATSEMVAKKYLMMDGERGREVFWFAKNGIIAMNVFYLFFCLTTKNLYQTGAIVVLILPTSGNQLSAFLT